MDLRNIISSSNLKPGQILKVVISISVVLLVVWLFMISRMELSDQHSTSGAQTIERTDNLRNSISENSNTQKTRSSNIFQNAFTTFIVLLFILVIVFLITKNWQNKHSSQDLIKIAEHVVGQGAHLKVIEINNEVWVIGVTSSNVNLLHRYSKDEWNDLPIQREDKENSFKSIFNSKL